MSILQLTNGNEWESPADSITGIIPIANGGTGNDTGTAVNVSGTVAVANGGTGATSAANARSNLGASSVLTVESKTITDNYTLVKTAGHTFSGSISSSGKTPLGIVGFQVSNASSGGKNANWCGIYETYMSGTTGYLSCHNYSTSADAVIKVILRVLYKAN